jgi:N-acetylmuramoyl-L-alanine amidase
VIAICVGHSRPGDRGAVSVDGTTEHAFNARLADLVSVVLDNRGIPCRVIDRYQGKSYGSAMTWLAARLRELKATLAAELHFNASDVRAATGHEWLYLTGSHGGRETARCLAFRMGLHFPAHHARGVKALGPRDRGAQFLCKSHCPAVLCEPFFGTNAADWERVGQNPPALAAAIAAGLEAAYDILTGKAGHP